jgi:hypothetical protein
MLHQTRKRGEQPMSSRSEILKKVKTLEQTIETRSKRLAQLEAMDDPEAIIEAVKIKEEIKLLGEERSRLLEKAENLKALLESRLPQLEKAYLDAVKEERTALRKLYDTCKNLLTQIRELRKIANDTHMKFIPYKNHCDELGIVAKSMHLLELPFMSQIERWLGNFIQWYEKVQAK